MFKFLRVFLVLFHLSFWAQAFEVPPLTDSVVDEALFLDENVKSQLSNALKIIHDKGGPQVAVLTVSTIDPLTIEEASYKVAKNWQLGTAQKDNGVLLMIAKKERKIRIEVGQGVEGDLTDAYSRRIIDDIMVPAFREGQTNKGILWGVSGILLRMDPPYHLEDYMQLEKRRPQRKVNWGHLLLMIAVFLFLMYINRHGGGGGGRYYRGGGLGGGFYGGGGFGGGFGGSSGGWSGGGGGFSGGGASGSW
jgi:uncharacterized protein